MINSNRIKTIYLVGAGRMGGAMLKGWVKNLDLSYCFVVIDPHISQNLRDSIASIPSKHKITFLASSNDVNEVGNASVVVLATKPHLSVEALNSLKTSISAQTLIISVAAGIQCDTLSQAAPNSPIVRAMPNIGAMVGYSTSAACASVKLGVEHRSLVEAVFTAIGTFTWLKNEDDLHAVTAVSGSGPAYFFAICEAMIAAAENEGLSHEVAERLVLGTILASSRLLEETPDPKHLRETVTSPNGTTAAGLSSLTKDNALETLIAQTIASARKSSEELSSL